MEPLNGPTSKGSDVDFGQLFGVMFYQNVFLQSPFFTVHMS